MANYLSLTNQVLDNLRWDPISQAEFASPSDPAPSIKRFINQAKDEVFARIGGRLVETEFLFETNRQIDYATSGNTTIVSQSGAGTLLVSSGGVFSDWMVGAKIGFPTSVYTQLVAPAGAGPADTTWRRILSVVSPTVATIDAQFTEDGTLDNSWTIWKDEYELDPSVRQVMAVWTSNGPVALDFVSNTAELDRYFPGTTMGSTPDRCAVYRSSLSGSIWAMKLYPAPTEHEIIRYRAKYRLPDLSLYSDSWSIEPEIESMIVDQATVKAVQTPIQNDPDLAEVLGRDVQRRAVEWKLEYTPSDSGRRMRRQTPGDNFINRGRRVRFQVENS